MVVGTFMVMLDTTVNAFHEVFLIGAIIVLLALIPSLILRKPKPVEQAQQSPARATD